MGKVKICNPTIYNKCIQLLFRFHDEPCAPVFDAKWHNVGMVMGWSRKLSAKQFLLEVSVLFCVWTFQALALGVKYNAMLGITGCHLRAKKVESKQSIISMEIVSFFLVGFSSAFVEYINLVAYGFINFQWYRPFLWYACDSKIVKFILYSILQYVMPYSLKLLNMPVLGETCWGGSVFNLF